MLFIGLSVPRCLIVCLLKDMLGLCRMYYHPVAKTFGTGWYVVSIRHVTPLPRCPYCLRWLLLFVGLMLACVDIDDALHARALENGNFEVGVHIADVTHFVKFATAMDDEAKSRGTTVYLVDKRIDMLPMMLGTDLCSLVGGKD